MKIAIITKYIDYHGGVEVYHEYLKEVLEKWFGNVKILVPGRTRPNILSRFLTKLTGDSFFTRKYNAELSNYDLVICNGEHGWGIDHPNCICIYHGTYYGYKKYLKGKLKLRSFIRLTLLSIIQKQAARDKYIVAVSEPTKDLLANQKIKTSMIISGCVKEVLCTKEIPKMKNGKLLFIGRYDYFGKGFDILEDIASVGYTIDCVTDYNPGNKLNWLKIRSHQEILSLYHEYFILVFPSRSEGFPLVPLEAMATGLPVVVNDIGYYKELKAIIPEFFVKDNSVDEYITAIKRIESNYKYYSDKAINYVRENHNFSIFEQNVIKMIEKVLSNNENEHIFKK